MNPWIVLAAILFAALFLWKFRSAYRSPEQLRRIADAIDKGAPLIDVRTAAEFSTEHLPNAVNLPLGAFGPDADVLGTTSEPVVLYCASGARSGHAARMLRKAGFKSVLDLGPMSNGRRLPAPNRLV